MPLHSAMAAAKARPFEALGALQFLVGEVGFDQGVGGAVGGLLVQADLFLEPLGHLALVQFAGAVKASNTKCPRSGCPPVDTA